MTIAEIVDEQVMKHLGLFGCVKNMEPFALHMLKTSEHPLLQFRRTWMRQVALRQDGTGIYSFAVTHAAGWQRLRTTVFASPLRRD